MSDVYDATFCFFPTDKTDKKPTKILKDVEESANLIDTDDFYPSFRPSIDCDVLNSVIVEENDEDMQSLNSSIATSNNDFEKSRQIDAGFELSPKILSNRPMCGATVASEAGVLEDSAMAQPNRDISVGGQDKFQQISQTNIQSPADKEILEIEKTQTTDQLITHSNPNNFASDEINTVDSRQANRKNKFSVSSRCVSGVKYLGFFSSRSLKTREKFISFAQFVYILRKVCLLFNF